MKEFNIDIPIQDKHTMLIDGVVQFDAGDKVSVTLLSNGSPYDFSQSWTQLQLSILKPDGTAISTVISKGVTPTENPYELTVVDDTVGRIDFVLKGQATIVQGIYVARLTLFNNTNVLCTSRINYHVEQNNDTLSTDTSDTDYSVLKNLISTISGYSAQETARGAAESSRVTAENGRVSAETSRVSEFAEIQQQASQKLAAVDEIVSECEIYAERAEAAAAPSTQAITNVLTGMGWPNTSELNTRISTAITTRLNQGLSGDTITITVKKGLEANVPTLGVGEMWLSTDTLKMYIGTASGNKEMTEHYNAGSSSPSTNNIFWVDTSSNNTLKFKQNNSWIAVSATAVFG